MIFLRYIILKCGLTRLKEPVLAHSIFEIISSYPYLFRNAVDYTHNFYILKIHHHQLFSFRKK